MISDIRNRGTHAAFLRAPEDGAAPMRSRAHHRSHAPQQNCAVSAHRGFSGFETKGSGASPRAESFAATQGGGLQGSLHPIKPSTGPSPAGSAEWGILSTAAQTQALTPEQSSQVGRDWAANLKRDFGLTNAQAAGIVGNLWHESGGMNSGISQGGRIGLFGDHQDDNAHGIGIAQWGGSRADGLLQYAKDHGLDPTCEAANYGFLKQELSGPYSSVIDAVKQSSDLQGATAAFCNSFEKPTDPQMASRNTYAQQVLSSLSHG